MKIAEKCNLLIGHRNFTRVVILIGLALYAWKGISINIRVPSTVKFDHEISAEWQKTIRVQNPGSKN